MCKDKNQHLCALATNAAGELDVLGHDGSTLGMDCAQVGVLEQGNQVCLRGLLQCRDSRRLKAKVGLEVLRNLADQALEGELADQELGRLLVLADLTKRNGTWAVTMGLLDTASGRRALAGGLGGELLAGGLASGGLAGGLFSTSHLRKCVVERQTQVANVRGRLIVSCLVRQSNSYYVVRTAVNSFKTPPSFFKTIG